MLESGAGVTVGQMVPDYELLKRIGGGAYGEVWLARSKATGILRAAKIVWRRTFADDRPFLREFEGIQHFERISREHPNQLALFHIGRNEAGGFFYYVMELADNIGTETDYSPHTLRADLQHGLLPPKRVVEIGLALAEALGHLHSHGLIHRDVKPSNVIFVNGKPKLADIGLVTDASDTCSIVGTEGYLPCDGPGTPQADIYALGKVLYEAATGLDRRKFPDLPPDLKDWPDSRQVPELNEIVLRACATDSTHRYSDCDKMRTELAILDRGQSVRQKRIGQRRWRDVKRAALVAVLAALGVVVVLEVADTLTRRGQPSAPQEVRIAVLPFANASPDRISNYVTVSLTYEVINGLQNVAGIKAFRAQSSDQIRDVLNPLGALLVEGSVEEKNGKLNIEVQLLETFTGGSLVSTNYQRNLTDLLGIPNDITLLIAAHLNNRLSVPSRDKILKLPTPNPVAYDYYLRGRGELVDGFLRPDLGTKAIPDLEQAIKCDTNFALALATLSRCYVIRYFYLKPEEQADLEPKAKNAFENALSLQPDLAEAHFAKGSFFWTPSQGWNVGTAIAEYLTALKFSPNSEEISGQLALAYLHVGLFEKAHDIAKQGGTGDPLSNLPKYFEANAFFWEGNNKKAVSIWEGSSAGLKGNFVMNSYLAVALINLNKTNEALEIINGVLRGTNADIGGLMASADAILRAKQGNRPGAEEEIKAALRQRESFGHFHHALYNIASAYALLEDTTNAMIYLRKAADDGFPCFPLFRDDKNLTKLYGNPDWEAFMKDQREKHQQYDSKFGAN